MSRRRFKEIRESILQSLLSGSRTVNEISRKTNSKWEVVMKHLEWLEREGKVTKVVTESGLKIYSLR